jgi:UDP-GlcNAc:undecaprenyl-phosphate GlcNAc-1-phosphate transferase
VNSVTALLLGVACSAVLAALLVRLRLLIAIPLPNRWHRIATPATGGIALFAGFVVAVQPGLVSGVVDHRYVPLVLGAAVAFALGLWDDRRTIGVRTKLASQTAVATAAAVAGVRPDWLPASLGIPLAVVILVASMNSFNLLDNMDGLAAGTAVVAATGLALVGGLVAGSGSPVVASALAGACLGFLPFNYRPRRAASLFMGDSGSHLLGFTLGALALLASPGGAGGAAVAVAAPLLILALPALDTGLVMIVRFSEGRPVWEGGRDHSSHRLVYHGLTERRAVAVLLGITANCTATAIALVIFHDVLLTAVAAGTTLAGLVAFAARLVLVTEEGLARMLQLSSSAAVGGEEGRAQVG